MMKLQKISKRLKSGLKKSWRVFRVYHRSNFNIKGTIYLVHFSSWKFNFLCDWFPGYKFVFISSKLSEDDFLAKFEQKILRQNNKLFFIWGLNGPEYLIKFLKRNDIEFYHVEDGFLRSKALGANHSTPASLVFDSRTLYFDSTSASDLEELLNHYDFCSDGELLLRASRLREKIIDSKVSKYNLTPTADINRILGLKNKKRVLVLGQVEDDASIKYGCNRQLNNKDLLEIAISENLNCEIIYKPHPDIIHKKRKELSIIDDKGIVVICDDISLHELFESIDHVYTLTSLSGFEALIYGIRVTTLGCPFYSGWGLTDDRQLNSRRRRKLSIDELIAGVYILYPKYFHPKDKRYVGPEEIIDYLVLK